MGVTGLLLENIRCFYGINYINLRPLTLLVGENSTGKTTIIGSLAPILKAGQDRLSNINFNNPPFQFGRFENIASFPSKREGKSNEFSIGLTVVTKIQNYPTNVHNLILKFKNSDGKPKPHKLILQTGSNLFFIKQLDKKKWLVRMNFEYINANSETLNVLEILNSEDYLISNTKIVRKWTLTHELPEDHAFDYIFFKIRRLIRKMREKGEKINRIFGFYGLLENLSMTNIRNIAPIRTKPERTYESHREVESPEGEHIPFQIERIFRKGNGEKYINTIKNFGKTSGLFSLINVRRFGKPKGSRFELTIRVNGPVRNIVDVGYGVSQVLPILVDSILADRGSIITFQEPEVHLHPKAQAELGSLFVQLVKEDKKQLIVETHSDYIVDRVRQQVAKGEIDNKDVLILFTELVRTTARINEIEIDKKGNIINPPENYRKFFMEETLSLLKKGY